MSQAKAQLESAVSTLISYMRAAHGVEVDVDGRDSIRQQLMRVAEDYNPDTTSWPYVKHKYLYDVYLQARQEEGSLTDSDMTRAGLTKANFTEEGAYFEHMARVSAARRSGDAELKKCNTCGFMKPLTSFKRKGGAKCNSCRSRGYRNRKAKGE